MQLVINIGLNSESQGPITVEKALASIREHAGRVINFSTTVSDTEPTLVAEVDVSWRKAGGGKTLFSALCADLGQDCVALYSYMSRTGWLFGPKADAWGPFNPEFFFTIKGERLATN